MKELGAKGHLKDPGQPLEATGKVVSGKAKTVTDGPFAEQGPGRRLHAHRGEGPRAGRRAVAGLPDLRRRRHRRGAARHEDGHVVAARRAPLPARVGATGRRADARLRRPQPGAGRGRRAGRPLPRAGGVEVPRRAGQSVGVADGDGEEPRDRRRCGASAPRARSRPSSAGCSRASGRSRRRSTSSSSRDAIARRRSCG